MRNHRAMHGALYSSTLREQLDHARQGLLSIDWRDELAIRSRLPTAGHLCLLKRERGDLGEIGTSELRRCAWLDVAHLDAALWEPYAVGGDWRAALDAWYAASMDAFEEHLLTVVHASGRFCGVGLSELIFRRDMIEASYRAGIAAGAGKDNGWRDWLATRSAERWEPERADCYRMAMLEEGLSTEPLYLAKWTTEMPFKRTGYDLSFQERLFVYRKLHNELETLPAYWTAARTSSKPTEKHEAPSERR
jgi:hypothetical protein